MSKKNIVQETWDTQLATESTTLNARLQVLENKTQLSRERLIKPYKELHGNSPPKSMLSFSTNWFMAWEQNVHTSMFCNAQQFLLKTGLCDGVDAVIRAYRLYLEQYPQAEEGPLLALTRVWTLVQFVESRLLQLSSCSCRGGNFTVHARWPVGSSTCSLRQPPSRAVKRRKLSQNPAGIILQLLDEQKVQAV